MKQLILSALLTLLVTQVSAAEKPNIVIILADDLGYTDTSCYGATKIKTPNIDRLAKEGMRFTDAHSPAAVCSPSRYGLVTGEYPFRNPSFAKGVLSWTKPLGIDVQQMTIGSLARSQGYATGVFGKWHMGMGKPPQPDFNQAIIPGPFEVGFDESFTDTGNLGGQLFVENGRVVGAEQDNPFEWVFPKRVTADTIPGLKGGKKAQIAKKPDCVPMTTDKAIAFLDKHKTHPFLMYLAPFNVHVPIKPGKNFEGQSECGPYGDYVIELDWIVGEVLNALDRNGITDNSLVLFTSDNGGGYYKPEVAEARARGHRVNGELLGQKTDIWEGGHRVPFIVRWPGKVTPGTVSDSLVSLVDVLATQADILGVKLPEKAGPDSHSFLHVLTDSPAAGKDRDSLIYQGFYEGQLAIRQGPWTLIPAQGSDGSSLKSLPRMMPYGELGFVNSGINPDGTIKADAPPGQLYNLDEDISQAKNIYREHPEQVEKLTALMKKIVGKGTRAPVGESASSAKGDTEPMQPSKPKVSNPKAQPKNSVLHADRKVPPNILFILTDDLGYGDLKSYNAQSEINTPHLDRLAKESVRFTDAYAAFPVCSPSRAAILTGQYVQRFGPNAEHYGTSILPDQHPTVAPLLKQAGYSTACLGKWNVNNSERQTIGANQHGFDHWFGFHINIDSHKHVVDRTGEADFLLNNKPVQREGWADTLFADDAIRLIDESKPEQPFFIYASFQTPHTPLQDPDDPSAPIADGRSSPKSRAVYVKMVEQLDTDIGRILAKLDAKGVAKNTLVVFTSDNGGSLNALQGPLKGHKLQLDEGGIRIPQFIRWPDVIPAGSTSAMPTIHMDLTRTILAAAGITDTGKVGADGRDLLPALSGDAIAKAALEERPLFWRHRDPQSKTDAIVSACVRVGDWKFQRKGDPASGKTVETLYNLGDDIGETNNLSRAEPNKLASLKSLLIEWEKEVAPASAVLTPPAVKTQKPPASDQSEAPKLQSAIEWSGGSMLVDGSSISTIIGKPDEYDVQAHDLRYLAEGDMTLQVDFDTKTDPNAQGTVLEWFDSKSAGFFRVSILRLAQQEVIYPQRTALLVVHGSSELKGKNWYDAANRLLAVPLNETQMTGMKTLCLRRTGTVLEAWLDGELLVTRDYQQPFFKLSLSEAERPFRHENGSRLRIGGGNSAGAFISPIKRVEVCKGSWDDARLLATFGLEKLIAPTRAELGKRESGRRQPIAGRLLPDSWTEKQKLDHVSGRLPDLMRQLQKDPHFPQYHLATPFAGHDSKSFGFQGYHFTPTASIDWYGLTGRRDLLWLHFFSPDLKAWSIRPIPYGSNIGANGNTIAWNGGVFTLIGKSPATGGNVLEGRASDLADWTESHRPIFVDKNPHGDVDRDPYLFIHEGKPWMVTAEHKSEKFPRFFLYSGNDDLSHWRYEGVLFQGDYPDPAHFECPSFFRIGQKFVFMHGAPYKVAENGHLVHIGRFEDKKFIKETSMPAIIPGWNGVHSVIEEPSKDRVLWFGYGKPLDTISGVQRGWSRTYPIVELRFDEPSNQIHVFPLREYEEMKTQRIMQHSGEVQPGRPVKLEHSFGSSFILDADLSLADGAKLTITLRNGQGEALTMTLTSEQMKLGAEATVAASKGETHSIKFCSDRSIFELYDNAGHALIHQFFPQDTEWRSIELSANGAAVSVSKLTADKVRSVWKNES